MIWTSPPRRAIASRASSGRSAGSRATISGHATGHSTHVDQGVTRAHPKAELDPAGRHPEREPDPPPARGRRDLGRRHLDLVQAAARERLDHGLALPEGVVGGRQMLQLAAAAGPEMPAGRRRPGDPLEACDRRRDQAVGAPGHEAHPPALAGQRQRQEHPGAADLADAVAARAELLDRELDQIADLGRHRGSGRC